MIRCLQNEDASAHDRDALDRTDRSIYDYKDQEESHGEKMQNDNRTPTRSQVVGATIGDVIPNGQERVNIESIGAYLPSSPIVDSTDLRSPGRKVQNMPFTSPKMFSSMLDLSMNITKDTSADMEKLRLEGAKLFDNEETITQILKSPTLKTDASAASSFFRGEHKKVSSVIGHTLVPTISSAASNSLPPLPHPQKNLDNTSISFTHSFLFSPSKLDFETIEAQSYVNVNTPRPGAYTSGVANAPSTDKAPSSGEVSTNGVHKINDNSEAGIADDVSAEKPALDGSIRKSDRKSSTFNQSLTRKIFAPKLPTPNYVPPPTAGHTIIVEESIVTGYFKSTRKKGSQALDSTSADATVSVHVEEDDDADILKMNTLGATSFFAKSRLSAKKKFAGKGISELDSTQFPPGYNFFRPVELVFALLSQFSSGVIAGITLQTLLSFIDGDDLSMITTLRSYTKVTRPIIFILSTLAFLGSLNSTLAASNVLSNYNPISWLGPWQSLDTSNKALVNLSRNYSKLFTLSCLYCIIFMTVLMTKQLESYLGNMPIPWGNPKSVYPDSSTLDPNVDDYYVATYTLHDVSQWQAWIGLLVIRILAATAVFFISFMIPYGISSVYDVQDTSDPNHSPKSDVTRVADVSRGKH